MSDTILTVSFTNYSSIQWNLDVWGANTQEGVSGVTQEPSQTLQATGGMTTYQYQQDMAGSFASGDAALWCCWNNGTVRFGVKLSAPYQMFGLGSSPFWYYMSDSTPLADVNWVCNDDRAAQYVWPASIGYNIVAAPDSESSTLNITVTIQDA